MKKKWLAEKHKRTEYTSCISLVVVIAWNCKVLASWEGMFCWYFSFFNIRWILNVQPLFWTLEHTFVDLLVLFTFESFYSNLFCYFCFRYLICFAIFASSGVSKFCLHELWSMIVHLFFILIVYTLHTMLLDFKFFLCFQCQ